MSDWTATGKRRYRSQQRWGGREELVMQIEERGIVTTWSAGQIDSEWMNRWRDATTSDLTTAEREFFP